MGNCTAVIKAKQPGVGAGVLVVADVTMSASYATGGDTLPLSALGLDTLTALVLCGNAAGYVLEAVHGATIKTDPKIRAWEDKATAAATPFLEEGSGTGLTGVTVRVLAYGNYPYV